MPEHETIEPSAARGADGGVWTPLIGEEAHRFLDQRPADMKTRLEREGVRILGKCVRPGSSPGVSSKRAGLVLGYVQSGKTSSFTTVTALARDNEFRLVIIIAGTTALLQDQTVSRLTQDLELGQMDAWRRWTMFKNPSPTNDEGAQLAERLAQFTGTGVPIADIGVPLVVVMKQHLHLSNLISLLESVHGLEQICSLVIDDEAHMHSPDVGKPGEPSPTYIQVRRLRETLPVHTLLQYTATPQAPLLANITDELSPEFVCLLEPGDGYAGGRYFFVEHHDQFVRPIPDEDLYALDPDEFVRRGPPATLRAAFLTYIVNCAVMRQRGQFDHRAMLVHPHSTKAVHTAWFSSIRAMQTDLQGMLNVRDEPDFTEWVDGELRKVWDDLDASCSDLPALEKLLPHLLPVLSLLVVKKVNSAAPPDVPWNTAPYWVLVGGNLLGVGYTVEGLCVTHMMRATGVRLADTIQQRARFFGYKAAYAPSCRAWLQPELDHAFVDYVDHEGAIRSSLKEFDEDMRPLREWKRVFLLDDRFKLTRRAAQRLSLAKFRLNEGWCMQRWYASDGRDIFEENRSVLEDFLSALAFSPSAAISGDTEATSHDSATCPQVELRRLLTTLRFQFEDSARFNALSFLLAQLADDPRGLLDECIVVGIAAGSPQRRERGVTWGAQTDSRLGEVALHQGRNPRTGPIRYGGDKQARDDSKVTLQVHWIDLLDGANGPRMPDAEDTPFVAVYVPEKLQKGVSIEA